MKTEKPTYVYLMVDMRNSIYKIGFSNNPVYREKTLQSEQPMIMLVDTWEGTRNDEKKLHKMFEGVRMRGEWFKLERHHISQIYRYFYGRSHQDTSAELQQAERKAQWAEQEAHYWRRKAEKLQEELNKFTNKPKPIFALPDLESEKEIAKKEKARKLKEFGERLSKVAMPKRPTGPWQTRLPDIPQRHSLEEKPKQATFGKYNFKIPHSFYKKHVSLAVVVNFPDPKPEPRNYTDEIPF